MSRIPAACIVLLALSSPLFAATEPQFVYEADELEQMLDTTSVRQKSESADAELAQLIGKAVGNPVTEARLQSVLLQLPLPLTEDALALVHQARERGGVIHVWMSHEANRRVPVPAIDTGATASLLLRKHAEAVAAEGLRVRLRSNGVADGDAATWAGLVASLPSNELAAIKPALLQAMDRRQPVESALIAYARRSGDHETLSAVILRGDVNRLPMLFKDILAINPDRRQALLREAVDRRELRDAVIGQLGDQLRHQWAWQAATDALASKTGGTDAAVMLAQNADSAQLYLLKDIASNEGIGASRAALALHLNDGAEARFLLDSLLRERPDGPLSSQIREWLR